MLRFGIRRDDEGFTLIEMIVTMTIIGIIVVPLSEVVITYLLNSATINARMYESKDQQIAAQYWAQDVAALGGRNPATFGPTPGINVANCTPFPGIQLISMSGARYALTGGTATTFAVTYSRSGTKIVRTSCATGTANSATVANTVDTATPIVCSTDGGATWVSCPGLTGTSSDGKSELQMRFRVADASGKGQPYLAILGGQRRQTS